MTKQEFETLTGKQVTEAEFDKIHEMYMNVGDNIDKQTFCKNYSEIATNPLFNSLVINYNRAKEGRIELEKELKDAARLMIEKADEHDDRELQIAAESILGTKEVLIFKLNNEYDLNGMDRTTLLSLLK